MGCDSQFDDLHDKPPKTMNDTEKIADVEAKLDGKITFTQLEQAKTKLKEAQIEAERTRKAYWEADRVRDDADQVRSQAERTERIAQQDLDILLSKWKSQ